MKRTVSLEDKLATYIKSIINVNIFFDSVNQLLGTYPKDKHRVLHKTCSLHLKNKTKNIADIFKGNE